MPLIVQSKVKEKPIFFFFADKNRYVEQGLRYCKLNLFSCKSVTTVTKLCGCSDTSLFAVTR